MSDRLGPRVVVDDLWQAYRVKTERGRRERGRQRRWALRGVTLRVGAGEAVGVVGRNGSGKTTLLRSIAGILHPDRGTVETVGGVASLVDLTAGIARDLTGRENLLITGVLLGMTRAEVRARSDGIADFAELDAAALEAPLYTYSSGMVLRLGFALVVHSRPAVLCIDEVLAVGDERFQQKCVRAVEELRAGGCAVVVASHDLELISANCDRLVVLDDGEVAFLGPTADGVARYQGRATDLGVQE
jgi:ABC-type polysaccharide/polyol phosphate transport system ATPase subunit